MSWTVKLGSYAFKEANHTMRAWPYKSFKEINLHQSIGQYMLSEAVKVVPDAPIWLESSQAERCDYVTFNPKEERIFTTKHVDHLYNLYNLYAGLQVQPIKGKWDMIKDFSWRAYALDLLIQSSMS